MIRGILVALSAALVLAPPSAAAGATSPPLRFLTTGATAADGERYVIRAGADRTLRVLDSRTERAQTVAIPAGCDWRSLGRGYLLFDCSSPNQNRNRPATVFDLATSSSHQAPPPDPPLPDGYHPDYWNVGAVWLERAVTHFDPHPSPTYEFVNWHTGQVLARSTSPTEVDDPDFPGLHRPLCSPLHRVRDRPSSDFYVEPFGGYQYEPPYGLATVENPADDLNIPYYVLQRCGSSGRRFVCRGCFPQLGGGILTWHHEGRKTVTVWAEILRTGVRFHWDLPRARFPFVVVRHTYRRVYVSTSGYSNLRAGATYSARLR